MHCQAETKLKFKLAEEAMLFGGSELFQELFLLFGKVFWSFDDDGDDVWAAVAIGSEGHGLSAELLSRCDGEVIIPMSGAAESLNAGVAAAIVMWEMCRGEA